jgi:DNA-directed RNA polymerase I, II, and III subunit RPABC2
MAAGGEEFDDVIQSGDEEIEENEIPDDPETDDEQSIENDNHDNNSDDEESDNESETDNVDDIAEENEETQTTNEEEHDNNYEYKVEPTDTIYRKLEIRYNKKGEIDCPYHRSSPFMTKYEYNNILVARIKMLENGHRPFVKVYHNKDKIQLRDIAIQELKEKKLPFIVKRPFPNGRFEYWRVKDLIAWQTD